MRPAVRPAGSLPGVARSALTSVPAFLSALLLCALLAAPADASASIFDRRERNVVAGNEAFAKGDAAAALQHYEEATKERPDESELHYNRGTALFKLERYEEAVDAFTRALAGREDEALGAGDYYNMGNTLAAMNETDAAIRSFRHALEIDPDDELARHNLGVMLRRKQQEQKGEGQKNEDHSNDEKKSDQEQSQDGEGEQGESQGAEGQDKGAEKEQGERREPEGQEGQEGEQQDSQRAEAGEGEQKDGRQGGQGEEGEEEEDGSQGAQGAGKEADQEEGDDAQPGRMSGSQKESESWGQERSRTETERILDSIRSSEKSFQLWRYQQKGKQRDADKDW